MWRVVTGMISNPVAQAGTALSPEWDRGFDEAFTELVCGDPDLVRAEFDALIGASFDNPPTPRRHPPHLPPGRHPPIRNPTPRRHRRPPTTGASPALPATTHDRRPDTPRRGTDPKEIPRREVVSSTARHPRRPHRPES